MSKRTPAKFTDEQRAKARELYLETGNWGFVVRSTGIPLQRLRSWSAQAQVSWQTEREELVRGLLEDGFNKRKVTISEAANVSPDLLLSGLKALAARDTPLSTQEMERVMAVHAGLDRIARLDAGKSTENLAVKAKVEMSLEEVQAILKADPAFGDES